MSFLGAHSDDEQWAPVSDLMAVIMLIFMLIAMVLFVSFNLEHLSNQEKCTATRDMLDSEFKDDFKIWGAELTDDLTIRFTNQNVLFKAGSSDVERERDDDEKGIPFSEMLQEFFPRYMKIISKDIPSTIGEDEVKSIRIEGHTSKEYNDLGEEAAYIHNMELSQDRARKILQYVLDSKKVPQAGGKDGYGKAARDLVTANGLSSSRLILCKNKKDEKGRENRKKSRRVEFKLLTDSCQKAGKYDKKSDKIPDEGCWESHV